MIKQKALDVSRQVEIYLAEHSSITAEEVSGDLTLAKIAVQPVGETGYTCLYEKETGIMRFHSNPELTDFDMHDWKDKLPSWWKIFEPSLDGSVIGGYYDWEDADGDIRKKFMYMVSVERTRYIVAATTYMDEFLKPSQAIRNKVIALEQKVEERTRDIAVLKERNRMAREIHDTLAQGFTGIVLQLGAAEQVLDEDIGKAQEHLDRARNLARESLNEARRSVWSLRPQSLEQLPLTEAVAQEINKFTRSSGVKTNFAISGKGVLYLLI